MPVIAVVHGMAAGAGAVIALAADFRIALLMTGRDYAEFHAAFSAGREPRWPGR